MASYGRNFEFRVPPVHGQRGGRYVLGGDDALPIGVPVKTNHEVVDELTGALEVELATSAQAPVKGQCGILVYELDPGIGLGGVDPVLTTFSDYDTVPVGKMVQVVSGDMVKVVFRNTEDRTFLQSRDYDGRIMVAGAGATPTVAVGDYLSPGTGNDTSGYWAESNAANGWLVVESVDTDRGEVEARFKF